MWVLVLCLSVPLLASASGGNLIGSLEAFRVIVADDGQENFLPADEAQPKDLIEYRLTYKNTGQDAVSNILITDPIPSGMQYIGESATDPREGRVEFSIDGGRNYQAWPIVIVETDSNGEEKTIEATPDMVTHIRWIIEDEFRPEGEVTVSYRTLIK